MHLKCNNKNDNGIIILNTPAGRGSGLREYSEQWPGTQQSAFDAAKYATLLAVR